MPFTKKPTKKICIICNKRKRRPGSLFCKTCSKKEVFIKIKALRESKDFKEGWIGTGPNNYGRLKTPEERLRNDF